ncbi:MAG: 3-phosphoshikimate 1-carboxyvinyltransferase [Vicinamibacterales bacterium]
MQSLTLSPAGSVRGDLSVPGDKSISHRYVLLSSLAPGRSVIEHLSSGADVAATMACVRALGAQVSMDAPDTVSVTGRDWTEPLTDLNADNSGTTMRLMAGLLAASPFKSTLTGDGSLRRRPMRRVIDPLTAMGARITSEDGLAPLVIEGGSLRGLEWSPPVPSAQIKSAVLLAGLRASGKTTVVERAETRDHTERAFPLFGLSCDVEGLRVSVAGGQRPAAARSRLRVPGDPSSAAVWAAAATALPGSLVHIRDVALNPRRIGFLRALERLGAQVSISEESQVGGEPVGTITAAFGDRRDTSIGANEVPGLIDELPVLAACAAAGCVLEVSGAQELRVKESDRITALVTGFQALGVNAEERPDGFVIDGRRQATGGCADAVGDHRLVMAFAIVALAASGPSRIDGSECVSVSYPTFEADLRRMISMGVARR